MKKSIGDWHILQLGYNLGLFVADKLQKENMERRQGFRNLDIFVFQVCISPSSHVIFNPNMIKYHEASASQSCFLFIYCITGFNISFNIQQQATKICLKLYHKNVFEMKSLLVDSKIVSNFFNEK